MGVISSQLLTLFPTDVCFTRVNFRLLFLRGSGLMICSTNDHNGVPIVTGLFRLIFPTNIPTHIGWSLTNCANFPPIQQCPSGILALVAINVICMMRVINIITKCDWFRQFSSRKRYTCCPIGHLFYSSISSIPDGNPIGKRELGTEVY